MGGIYTLRGTSRTVNTLRGTSRTVNTLRYTLWYGTPYVHTVVWDTLCTPVGMRGGYPVYTRGYERWVPRIHHPGM